MGQAGKAGDAERGRTGCNIQNWAGNTTARPITRGLAGAIACRALRDPWPPAHPPALQPTTLHDRALACPRCCKPTATSRPCAASLDESQPRRGLPCSCRPALCLRAWAPRWGQSSSSTREPVPLAHLADKKSRHATLEWLHCPHARPVPRLCIAPVSTAAIYPSASPLNRLRG